MLPIIGLVLKHFPEILLSVDTFRSNVAQNAIENGAAIVNDISAGMLDESMLETVAKLQVPYVMMHMKGNPQTMQSLTQYDDVVKEMMFYFSERINKARSFGLNDIIIDPALSFGSGHHETTSSCIEAIDEFVNEKQTVLDVGTGSGILAIAASKKGCIVDICDTDEVCITDTKSNFELNGVTFNDSWVGSTNKTTKKYDVVIANIVADVLVMISNDLKKCLNENGLLIISGILDKHINRVLSKFKDLEQVKLIHKNEWVTVVFKNNKEF
ncbi:MAG: 50S ribosomal protein L11 methyltransferase [Arcobacter sp.]|nr:50S ribosomal protein L11 methyltransferase [Arcobacter sp.]